MAFEVVMVMCAAWMIQLHYLSQKTYSDYSFYIIAKDNTRWWLDLLAHSWHISSLATRG